METLFGGWVQKHLTSLAILGAPNFIGELTRAEADVLEETTAPQLQVDMQIKQIQDTLNLCEVILCMVLWIIMNRTIMNYMNLVEGWFNIQIIWNIRWSARFLNLVIIVGMWVLLQEEAYRWVGTALVCCLMMFLAKILSAPGMTVGELVSLFLFWLPPIAAMIYEAGFKKILIKATEQKDKKKDKEEKEEKA